MKKLLSVLLLVMPGLAYSLANAASDEYPMRARYPDVRIITTADLAKQYASVVIVDVRTKYEYDTLHIKDAILLPLGTKFGEGALALRQ